MTFNTTHSPRPLDRRHRSLVRLAGAGLVVAAASLAACADDDGGDGNEGLQPGSATMSGVLTTQVDGSPIVGGSVCIVEMPEAACAETGADGSYTLTGLPDAAHVHARFSAPGYVPMNWSHDTSRPGETASPAIVPITVAYPLLSAAGATYDDQTAIFLAKAVDADIAGRTGITVAADLGGDAMGPVYLSSGGIPDVALTSTSTYGVAAFAQVQPGTYSLRYVAPEGVTCTPRWGWAGEGESSIEVLAAPGEMTFVEMLCDGEEVTPTTGNVTIVGSITDQATAAPIEGVMICVAELPERDCAETSADGVYELTGLPDAGHYHLRFDADAYVPVNWAVDMATADEAVSASLVPVALMDVLLTPVDAEFGDDTGVVLAKAVDTDILALSDVMLAGELGEGAIGPMYLSPAGVPDASLSATSSYGIGGWAEVAPGTYEVTFDAGEGVACTPRWGWSAGGEGTMQVTVVAGEITIIESLCD